MNKQFHSCICLTCGIRNDHSRGDGFCQNGHDDWFEYRDILLKGETFARAMEVTGLDEATLTEAFVNSNVKFIPLLCASADLEEEYYDDEYHESCPKCGRDYDHIDFDYQSCSKCGWDEENQKWEEPREPSDEDYENGDADILTGRWW